MENLIPILSLLLSAAAFFFTVLIYRRRRTFENENHFFSYKLEQYGHIIANASELLELIYTNLHDLLYEMTDGPNTETLDEISDEVEEKMVSFRVNLHKGCAFIPRTIIDQLDDLYEEIRETQECLEEEIPQLKKIEASISSIDLITEHLDEIINAMRTDMGIEKIDIRLKSRVK